MKWIALALFCFVGMVSANAAETEGFDAVVATTCSAGDLGKARLIRAAILSEESKRLLKVAEEWEALADKMVEHINTRELQPHEVERLEHFCQELRGSANTLRQGAEDLAELGVGVMITSLAVPDDLDEEERVAKCQKEFLPDKNALEKAWHEEHNAEEHLAPLLDDYRAMEHRLNSAYLKGQTPLDNFQSPIRHHQAKVLP